MKLVRLIICCLIGFGSLAQAMGQDTSTPVTQDVKGVVRDKATGKGVAQALVILKQAKLSVRTENSGDFTFEAAPAGPLEVIITCQGYKTLTMSLNESELKEMVNIDMEPAAAEIAEADLKNAESAADQAPSMDTPARDRKKNQVVLTGVVRDEKSGAPVANARITIEGTNNKATSHQDGAFSLKNPGEKAVYLTVSAQGYETRTLKASPGDIRDGVNISLQTSSTYELTEMDVRSTKLEVPQMMKSSDHASVVDVSPDLIAKLPSIGEADIFRTLQLMPGISGTNESSSGLYVRGGSPDQNLILLDGMPIYFVDHFFGFFSAFNASAIENVKIHKGGFGPRYGGRISSVVELTSKTARGIPETDGKGFVFGAGTGFLASNLAAKIPLYENKVSLFVAGRRSTTDILEPGWFGDIMTTNTEGNLQGQGGGQFGGGQAPQVEAQPLFYFYDLNGIITAAPNKNHLLSGSFYRSNDDLDQSIDTTYNWLRARRQRGGQAGETVLDTMRTTINRTDKSAWGNKFGLSGHWHADWSDRYATGFTITYTYFDEMDNFIDISSGTQNLSNQNPNQQAGGNTDPRLQDMRNKIADMTVTFDNNWQVGTSHKLGYGIQGTMNNITFVEFNSRRNNPTLEEDNTGKIGAVFLEDEMTFFKKLVVAPGIRLNYFEGTGSYYFDPRFNFYYKMGKHLKFKGAWGIYSQFVNRVIREDILNGSSYHWMLATGGNVPVSTSQHFVGGISFETPLFLVDMEAYHKKMDGLVEISERQSNRRTIQLAPEQLSLFEGKGTSQGLEVLLQKKAGDYTGWLAYTLSRTLHEFDELDYGKAFPALHDHTHEVKFINSYTWGPIDFSAIWIYATGQPYTAPLGSYQVVLLDGRSTEPVYHVSQKNEFRIPNYHRLDISAAYNLKLSRGNMVLGAGLFNAYNNKNVIERTFTQNDDVFGEFNTTSVPVTPNVFLRANYAF